MDVFEAIKTRRSIRKFKKRDVKEEELNKVIEAGVWAPSAGNLQSWEVIVVTDQELKSKISVSAYMRDFISDAPVILVLCANMQVSGSIYNDRGRELYCIQDAACAAENMLLAAHALGLGVCWVGSFDEEFLVKLLKIDAHARPVALLPLGYPDENPIAPPRDDLESFIHLEKY